MKGPNPRVADQALARPTSARRCPPNSNRTRWLATAPFPVPISQSCAPLSETTSPTRRQVAPVLATRRQQSEHTNSNSMVGFFCQKGQKSERSMICCIPLTTLWIYQYLTSKNVIWDKVRLHKVNSGQIW